MYIDKNININIYININIVNQKVKYKKCPTVCK